jgi:hypothetical protein
MPVSLRHEHIVITIYSMMDVYVRMYGYHHHHHKKYDDLSTYNDDFAMPVSLRHEHIVIVITIYAMMDVYVYTYDYHHHQLIHHHQFITSTMISIYNDDQGL